MSDWPRRIGRRALRATATLPTLRDWRDAALVAAVGGAALGGFGARSGLFRCRPAPPPTVARMLLVLIVPALGEELLFRAALTPARDEVTSDLRAVAPSTLAFVLWHVVEALAVLPGARRLFLRADFLAVAGVMGAAAAWLRRRSGSVWPAVALHWAGVLVWKTWLGGPTLAALAGAESLSKRSPSLRQ